MTMTQSDKSIRGVCTSCKVKHVWTKGGLCTKCRPDTATTVIASIADQVPAAIEPATGRPSTAGRILVLDNGTMELDAGGKEVGGFCYPFDPTKTVHTLTFPAGVSAHKAVTPVTYKLPAGSKIIVRRAYELLIEGQPVRNLAAAIEAGLVKAEIHEDQRQTPAARRKTTGQGDSKSSTKGAK